MLTFTLYEDTAGMIRAALTGLGGMYTGGPISAYYDKQKEQAARQAAALKSGNPAEMYDANQAGTQYLHTLGGMIPVVGAFTNMHAYKQREEAEKRARLEGDYGVARKPMYY